MNTMLAKIYGVMSAGDPINAVPQPDAAFVSFCSPGLPLATEDVDFGFLAQTQAQYAAAAAFSDLVNSIPNPRGFWSASDAKTYREYKKVLDSVKLAQAPLSPDEQKQLAAAKALLNVTATYIDPYTGSSVKTVVDSPLYQRYQDLQTDYQNALLAYNTLLITARLRPNDPAVQMDWNLNGPIYSSRVKNAYNKWVAGGKNAIENAIATRNLLEGRGPAQHWSDLRADYELSKRTDPEGNIYFLTKYFPEKFWDVAHATSWTKFTFNDAETHTVDTSTSSHWGGGAGLSFGLWSFGASAEHSSAQTYYAGDASNLSVEVELIKVPLRRSWWDAGVFKSRSWKFDDSVGDLLSDGSSPPSGTMIGYGTSIIIARNLKITMDMSNTKDASSFSSVSGGGMVGFGPFSIRGNYSSTTSSHTHDFVRSDNEISCAGMQILGFGYQLLPKCPNPDPSLPWP
jgi:hypothetical protein